MICKHCQNESNPASRICPFCGQDMGTEAEKNADVIMEDAPSIDLSWAGRTTRGGSRSRKKPRRKRGKRRSRLTRQNTYQKRMINWAKVMVSIGILLMMLGAGTFVYLKLTPGGQLIMARMGRDASADASGRSATIGSSSSVYWLVSARSCRSATSAGVSRPLTKASWITVKVASRSASPARRRGRSGTEGVWDGMRPP